MTVNTATEAEKCVTAIGAALEYMHDRGEMNHEFQEIVSRSRYTSKVLKYVDVAFAGRIVRIRAEDIGPYTGETDEESDD